MRDFFEHYDVEPEDQRDVMLKRLCKAIREVSEKLPSTTLDADVAFDDLLTLAEEVESYYEDNDPRSMGWVGDDGLP